MKAFVGALLLLMLVAGPATADPVEQGFDEWGYNDTANMFKGDYCDAYHGATWCQSYVGVDLQMKWNDAWDAGKAGAPWADSGAWITNHMSGDYEVGRRTCNWTYFTKIVAVPSDAVEVDDVWYTADGTEIGPEIWGAFATIQSVYNDPCGGFGGIEYLSPNNAGLGGY